MIYTHIYHFNVNTFVFIPHADAAIAWAFVVAFGLAPFAFSASHFAVLPLPCLWLADAEDRCNLRIHVHGRHPLGERAWSCTASAASVSVAVSAALIHLVFAFKTSAARS